MKNQRNDQAKKQQDEFFMQDTFNNKHSELLKLNSYASCDEDYNNSQQGQNEREKDKQKLEDKYKYKQHNNFNLQNKLEQSQTRIKILDSFQKSYLLNRKKSNISEYSINLQSSINEVRPRSTQKDNQNGSKYRQRSRSPLNKQNFSRSISKDTSNKKTHQRNQINHSKDNQNTHLSQINNHLKTNINIQMQIEQVKKQIKEELFLIEIQQEVHSRLIQLLRLKDKGKNLIKESTSQHLFKLYDEIGDYVNATEGYVSSIKNLQKFVE